MGMIKGTTEYQKFQRGERLSFKQAICAQCYVCNGEEEGGVDCESENSCPLYAYMPYGKAHKRAKRILSLEEKEIIRRRFANAGAKKKG